MSFLHLKMIQEKILMVIFNARCWKIIAKNVFMINPGTYVAPRCSGSQPGSLMWQAIKLCQNQCLALGHMMTSSNGNIFRVTGPLCGEFTGPGEFPTQRPVTRSFDVLFDLRLNKRLSKQPWGWWFETPSWSLWRQRNENAPHNS